MRTGKKSAKLALALPGVCLLLSGLCGLGPHQGNDAARLLGVWVLNQSFGSQLSGPVTVRREPAPWAYAGPFAVPGIRDGNGWTFGFPDGRGELRTTGLSGGRIAAMWVQPAFVTRGQPYASPATLGAIAPEVWRGRIDPLENRVIMTIHVVRRSDGRIGGFLRDPLTNIGGRFGTLEVRVDAQAVRFTSEKSGTLAGTLNDAGDSFALTIDGSGLPPLTFTRRIATAERTAGTRYREPLLTGDGWAIGSAAAAGIAPAKLVELTRWIAAAGPVAPTSPDVHSVLIARHGKLVFERYFNGFDEATPHDTRSAGKTYADVLAGVAMMQGAPLRDTTPLLTLFPQYAGLAHADPRKRSITVGNALSMSTGLDCDDNDEKSTGNEDHEQSQTQQPDWYRLVLDARMVRKPGTQAVYCSASINLAGGAIAGATRAWLPMFFEQHVAEPLNMQRYALNVMPTGQLYLGGGAYVRPRDFLKIGQVFLDGGTWNGTRILDRDWINRSWKARLALGPADDYGYAWHIRSYRAGAQTYRAYEAQGNGGQILDVLPQLGLAVMMTQGNYNNFRTWGTMRNKIMQRILDALGQA